MRFQKKVLILAMLLVAELGFGQSPKSKAHSHSKQGLNSSRGPRNFQNNQYPFHGLGIKMGDPFALTYKFYASKKVSVAVDFGKASSGLYNRYFREKFEEYKRDGSDTVTAGSSIDYSFHRLKADFITEAKLLYHISADKISPGLQVYVGGGWEWKNSRIKYDYFYTPAGSTEVNDFGSVYRRRFTMGPQIVAGIEYAYFQLPVSAFLELEYFTDILADPGWRRFEGGVGLRYIF